jgi:threonylcarbamoyladenosine tRNA methylthiotransferase MtaB
MPRVALHTLGCKLNFAETSSLGGQFIERGYELVEFGEAADVVLLNTCSVTERADRECRQLIRRALRKSPEAFVVVTGCYAQLAPEQVASIEGVDLVLGTKEKFSVFEFAGEFNKGGGSRVCVSEVGIADTFGPAMSSSAGDRTRGYLKVQDGCDYHCTFCTIPLARGESRSQSVDDCVRQAEQLVRQGFKEIVLTGVNVGDYGRKQDADLLSLLRPLVQIDGLHRIRISSIEPNLLTAGLLDFVAGHDVMCEHFHIPLQSGSDSVLRRMRRRYTTSHYADLIRRVRDRFPDSGIGADVIAGFPGETDEEFQETYSLLADLPISYLHVFTYSERPHTPAASMPAQVVAQTRSDRNAKLRILSERKRMAWCRSMVGKKVTLLTETTVEAGFRYGFTDAFMRVGVREEAVPENALVRVRITEAKEERCLGVVEGMSR